MVYTFDKANANAPSTRKTQYFEMLAMRGIYHDGWMASTTPPVLPWAAFEGLPQNAPKDILNGYKWELYDLDDDPDAGRGRRGEEPAEARRDAEGLHAGGGEVPGAAARQPLAVALPRAEAERDRRAHRFIYTGELANTPKGGAPSFLDRSYTITAEVEIPQGGAEGMLVTDGGRFGGIGFYLLKGKPVFVYNYVNVERFRWEGKDALPPGKHTLVFDFEYDGIGFGLGGTRHAEGGRPGGRFEEDPEDPAVHVPGGRDLRRRRRHAHADRRPRLPGAVPLHRQARQADRGRGADQGNDRADPRVQVEDARLGEP